MPAVAEMPVGVKAGAKNEDLLKRIKARYRYGMQKWLRNRDEGKQNMRYLAGDPWTDEEKRARKERPTVCADELNQYVNQIVNTARQNPRGVKIDPAGDNATAEMAEYRENRIRAIEYGCNAAQVYVNGLQAAVERNLGFWKVSRQYISDDTDEQEILLLPVPNPDTVLIDPDYKELDGSDIKWAFELDRMPLDEFKAQFPDAEKTSFAAGDWGEYAKDWFGSEFILVASYWEVGPVKRTGKTGRVIEQRKVRQYLTNGVEILKEGAVQPGPYIPIVPVFGKELWVDYTGTAERVLLSLVSLGRDPQKALAYVMSAMLEDAGQIPKATFLGATGMFETDADSWALINRVYFPTIQYDPVGDPQTGQPLGPPQRVQLTPNFQSYAVGVDVCRRAIMSAMGVNPLPTAAQRPNQKSGVALSKIESEQAIGSYHLVDAYDRAIKLTGRIVNNWLTEIDVGEGQRPVRLADGKHKLVSINTAAAVMDGEHEYHFPIADDQGRYQVTISSGPSHESQREEGSEFVDTLMGNLKNLPLTPPQMQKLMALGIRLKQLGPLGDQMADAIDPPNQGAQQAQQMAQMQAQAAQQGQQLQALQALVQKLMIERQGKMIDNAFKAAEGDKNRENQLAIAEVGTKAQAESERAEMFQEMQQQFHDQAHEVGMQAQAQAAAQQMAAQQPQPPQSTAVSQPNAQEA